MTKKTHDALSWTLILLTSRMYVVCVCCLQQIDFVSEQNLDDVIIQI